MTELAALIDDLRVKTDALAKAQPAVAEPAPPAAAEPEAVKVVEPVAAEGEMAKAEPAAAEPVAGEAPAVAEGEPVAAAEGEEMAKAIEVTLPDGSKAEALDGYALVKALRDDLDAARAEMAEIKVGVEAERAAREAALSGHRDDMAKSFDGLGGRFAAAGDAATMAKALSSALDAVAGMRAAAAAATEAAAAQAARIAEQGALIAEQGALVKSLRDDVARLGAQPTGRQSVLSVHERPSPAAAAPAMAAGEVLAKASLLAAAGKLGAADAARITTLANLGQPLPDRLRHLIDAA